MSLCCTLTEILKFGFEVMSNLTWNAHIDNISKQANRSLGFVKRTCGRRTNSSAKRLLYLSLVRSRLETGVPVWSVATKRNLLKLERVQRRATRFITSDSDYKSRLKSCNLLPLSFRRELLDLFFLFKCKIGLICIDILKYLSPFNPLRNTRNAAKGPLFSPKFCNTETYAYFYFNRVIPLWNALPLEARLSYKYSSFKNIISLHYSELFINNFDTNQYMYLGIQVPLYFVQTY